MCWQLTVITYVNQIVKEYQEGCSTVSANVNACL